MPEADNSGDEKTEDEEESRRIMSWRILESEHAKVPLRFREKGESYIGISCSLWGVAHIAYSRVTHIKSNVPLSLRLRSP